MDAFRYRAHGLCIHSEVELDLERDDNATSDLVVTLSTAAPPPAGHGTEVIRYDQGTTFSIADGRFVTAYTNAPIDDIEAEFLTGPAIAIALFQRGHAVLHASCVLVDEQAVAFIGPSRVGKSTLAGALVQRGHELFADDFIALDESGSIHRGVPRLRLWPDSARAVGFDAAESAQKRTLHVQGATDTTSHPLLFLVHDDAEGDEDAVTRLSPADTLYQLLGNSYCVSLFARGDLAQEFERWSQLSTTLSSFQLTRARGLHRLPETARLIERLAADS